MRPHPDQAFAAFARACMALPFVAVLALALGRCIPAPAPQPTYLPAASLQPVAARPQPRRFCGQFGPAAPPLDAVTCEDFAAVAEGTLPAGWLGGEGLVTRDLGGWRALVPFQFRDVERVTATGFRATGDYRLDWAVRLPGLGGHPLNDTFYRLRAGSAVVTFRTSRYGQQAAVWLRDSEGPELGAMHGQVAHLSLRREGNVQRLLLNNRQVIVARYDAAEAIDGISLEVEGPGPFALLGVRLAAAPVPPAPPAAPPAAAPEATQADPPPVRSVAVGDWACAQMGDLTVRCESELGGRPGIVPGLVGTASIRARGGTVCATGTDGRHRCYVDHGGWIHGGGPVEGPGPHEVLPSGGELVAPADGANDSGTGPLVLLDGALVAAVPAAMGGGPGPRFSFPGRVLQADQGADTTCAVLDDRSVRCATGHASAGVPVAGATGAQEVRVGWNNACTVLADAGVRCWGICRHGESEEGTPACRTLGRPRRRAALRSYPVALPGPARSLAVLGGVAYATVEDGTPVRWDLDLRGRPSNVRVVGGVARVRSFHGADGQVCAFHDDARVTCWPAGDPAARREVRF